MKSFPFIPVIPENAEPSKTERELARQSGEALAAFAQDAASPRQTGSLRLTLSRESGERIEATVPEKVVGLLADVLEEMARGRSIRLLPVDGEVTPNEAADILGVSRPHLVKLLDAGRIPFRRVGTHRRIRLDDLEEFREQERQARRKVLDELAAESERLGLYG
jgi:excisionase family DNA binding protein